jgi:drug/metabolite transporter (DMT)-like permease
MTRLLTILLVGLLLEAVGVVFLSKGLGQIGEPQNLTAAEVVRVIKSGLTNPNLLLGVFFEALFFGTLLILMAKRAEISFIWPLTALGFVFTTLAARFVLNENVPWVRWAGVLLIMAGAALITYSEKKEQLPKSIPPSPPAASRTQGLV